MGNMGLEFGLEKGKYCKRKNRYLVFIDGVSCEGVDALPPLSSSRPNLGFKEMIAKHVSEDVYYAAKPEWRPINLVLYDLKKNKHPVFEWIKEIYDPKTGRFSPPNSGDFIKSARVILTDGCGNTIETWNLEDVWPQVANFQELDMGSADVITVDLTLRYVRAYIS